VGRQDARVSELRAPCRTPGRPRARREWSRDAHIRARGSRGTSAFRRAADRSYTDLVLARSTSRGATCLFFSPKYCSPRRLDHTTGSRCLVEAPVFQNGMRRAHGTCLWAAALVVVAGGRPEVGPYPDAEEAAEINDAIEALSADYRAASLALRHRSRFVERMKVEAEDQGLVTAIEKEWKREYERVRALEQVRTRAWGTFRIASFGPQTEGRHSRHVLRYSRSASCRPWQQRSKGQRAALTRREGWPIQPPIRHASSLAHALGGAAHARGRT